MEKGECSIMNFKDKHKIRDIFNPIGTTGIVKTKIRVSPVWLGWTNSASHPNFVWGQHN